MPSSTVSTFSDPGDYAASFNGALSALSVTGLGNFRAQVTRIDLDGLRMHRFSENLPRIGHWDNPVVRAVVTFRTGPGPLLLFGGNEMQPTSITRHSEGESGFLRSTSAAGWGSISLAVDDLVATGAAVAGCDLTLPADALVHVPASAAMARLQRLHAAAGQLAVDAPEVIANPAAARGLQQSLLEALVVCLGDGEVREDRSSLRRHMTILRRFHQFMEDNSTEPVHMSELCAAIGVQERTLRSICQEQLGTSPKRYLLLHRMFLVRKALRESRPGATTVTEIATRYGFWELGRFAVEYRSLFSETPSTTLKHSLDR